MLPRWHGEGGAQGGCGVGDHLFTLVEHAGHLEKAVDHAVVAAQLRGLGLALIAERVVLGGDDEGWRQPVQVCGAQW
mgnify:CR=1 FL=1